MNAAAPTDYTPLAVQRRNVLVVAMDGAIIGLMSAAGTFVSVFVVRLGASAFWVSLLSSIPSAISLLTAIPWSAFAARQSRPQAVFRWSRLIVHTVYLLVALVSLLLKHESAAIAVVLVWSLSALPGGLSNIMFTVVMGHAVPREHRALLMSRRWTFMGIAQLLSLPLVSQIIERVTFPHGYQIAFAFNFVLATIAFFCISQLRLPERQPARPPRDSPLRNRIVQGLGEVIQAKSFLTFVSGRAIFNLGLALVSALITIYWVNHLHVSESWIGYFTSASSAATLVSYGLWVRLSRKLGGRVTLIAAVLGSALYPALLALTRSPWAVLPVIAFNGISGAGLNLAFFDALLENCPPDKEERFIAINMTALHLTGVVGPPIGAALLGVMDIRWVFVIGTLVALVGVAVFSIAGIGKRRAARRSARGQVEQTLPRPEEAPEPVDAD